MTNPETSAITIIGSLENPCGISFDPSLLRDKSAIKEIVRHQVFSTGSEITIQGTDEEPIKFDAYNLAAIRRLSGEDRIEKMQEIVETIQEEGVFEVMISSIARHDPVPNQIIFTRDHPREFANSLNTIDSI